MCRYSRSIQAPDSLSFWEFPLFSSINLSTVDPGINESLSSLDLRDQCSMVPVLHWLLIHVLWLHFPLKQQGPRKQRRLAVAYRRPCLSRRLGSGRHDGGGCEHGHSGWRQAPPGQSAEGHRAIGLGAEVLLSCAAGFGRGGIGVLLWLHGAFWSGFCNIIRLVCECVSWVVDWRSSGLVGMLINI